jgi:hypothetical protein
MFQCALIVLQRLTLQLYVSQSNNKSRHVNSSDLQMSVVREGQLENTDLYHSFIVLVMLKKLLDTFVVCLNSGKETEFHIEPEITLELMMAANYLHT